MKLFAKKKCDRCPREDEQELTLAQALELEKRGNGPVVPAVSISMSGQQVVSYPYLCGPCLELVSSFIQGAARQPAKASSTRERKPKEATEPKKPKESK